MGTTAIAVAMVTTRRVSLLYICKEIILTPPKILVLLSQKQKKTPKTRGFRYPQNQEAKPLNNKCDHESHVRHAYQSGGGRTNLKASMTKEPTGEAPAKPACQDRDTLLLVTSVTCGLEGGPGRSASSWFFGSVAPTASAQRHTKHFRSQASPGRRVRKPPRTFDLQKSAP